MVESSHQGMAAGGVVGVFQDVYKLLEVGVVCAKLATGFAKLFESEGRSVFLSGSPKW